MKKKFIIGSRGSKLALTQTYLIRDKLKRIYPELGFEVKIITTLGDKILDVALSKIGDKGLFTKEIEESLLRREIDFAVHSMKDLPTQLPKGLTIGAITKREDLRDALVSRKGFTITSLPRGAKVGTSSLRRRSQLLNLRNDLMLLDLRGNLDTRIRKMEQGLYDAIILAHAGIKRLGLELKLYAIPVAKMLPQAGQGALGIEMRTGDKEVEKLLKVLDNKDTRIAVEAERALLLGLEGGCQVPIGVYGKISGEKLILYAGVFSLDGKIAIRDKIIGSKNDAVKLGKKLARRFIKNKAVVDILEDIRKS